MRGLAGHPSSPASVEGGHPAPPADPFVGHGPRRGVGQRRRHVERAVDDVEEENAILKTARRLVTNSQK